MPKLLLNPIQWLWKKTKNILYKNPIRTFYVKKIQNKYLYKNYSKNNKRLIIFFTPGWDAISGGIISIVSLCEESAKLKNVHRADVFICSVPSDPLIVRYTKFKNDLLIHEFSDILKYFESTESLLIHIPEYALEQVSQFFENSKILEIQKIKNIHLNIMIQNIDAMSFGAPVKKLSKIGKVTGTTAHQSYTSPKIRKKFGHPIQKLSTYVSPEQYNRKPYDLKEDLMIISPDIHPRKEEIIKKISTVLPKLKMVIIKKMTYEQFKETISCAKWALTFGEGLDGYFIETIFSGGIGFSVFNNRFFTKDFARLPTLYSDYDSLSKNICKDIKSLNKTNAYIKCQNKQYELCSKYYDYKTYRKNLEKFYKNYFSNKGFA